MNIITKNKSFLFILLSFLISSAAIAQKPIGNTQLRSFYTELAQVNLGFTFPEGFKEIKVINTETFPFDYAVELPGADFEIWFRINTQKENEKLLADKSIRVSGPDSLYIGVAQDQIAAFTGDKNYLKRGLPPYILERYNADAGSTYLLNLNDSPITKHYKYALLIVLQKNKLGTLMAICFTNEKGPDFFKNMNKAGNCLKFK